MQACSAPIRVLIVDDHPAIQEALTRILRRVEGIAVCGATGSARQAMQLARDIDIDVVVVDISLEDAHGLDLLRALRTRHPHLQVVIFSMYDENVYAERALRAGALGYVMKSESTDCVVEAIRCAAEGEVYLSHHMASALLQKSLRGHRRSGEVPLRTLTDREMEVFQLLGQGYGVPEIADLLNLSRKTVETYRRRAKEKLGFDSVSQLLQHAVRWVYEAIDVQTDSRALPRC